MTSTKDAIIKSLSQEWPLTVKQIHQKLQRQYGIESSYQAVHKTIKQMLCDEVLEKSKNSYSISQKWVERNYQNAEQLSEVLKKKQPEVSLESLRENDSIKLSLKGIPEVGWFLVDKAMQVPNLKKKPSLALWRFCYSVVGLESKHLNRLKEAFKKSKWQITVEENNPVDHMFAETLKQYGAKHFKFGVNCATPLSDKMIMGDYITEITYPSWFRKLWTIQNRLPKKIIQFNLAKHFLLMREIQPTIHITVTKNSQLADEYRKEHLHKRGKKPN